MDLVQQLDQDMDPNWVPMAREVRGNLPSMPIRDESVKSPAGSIPAHTYLTRFAPAAAAAAPAAPPSPPPRRGSAWTARLEDFAPAEDAGEGDDSELTALKARIARCKEEIRRQEEEHSRRCERIRRSRHGGTWLVS